MVFVDAFLRCRWTNHWQRMVFEHLRPRATQTAYSESDTALYNTSYRDYTTTATILTVQSGGVARTRTRVSLALSPPGRLLLPLGWRRCGTRVGSRLLLLLLRARTSHGRKNQPDGQTNGKSDALVKRTRRRMAGSLIHPQCTLRIKDCTSQPSQWCRSSTPRHDIWDKTSHRIST